MAEDWRTAYGRVKMELEEYKETIVPALMDKIQELEKRLVPVNVRKPEQFVSVLGYAPGMEPLPTVVEVYLANGCWVTRTMILQEHEVTHWMEMPDGPGNGGDR